MQWPFGSLLPVGTALLFVGCYNSPVSIEENTLKHDKLDFSITLPQNLVAQGWSIKADRTPATFEKDYRIKFESPDFNILPPLEVEVRRQSLQAVTNEAWIERKNFASLQKEHWDIFKDWESLEETLAPISFSGLEGVEIEYLRTIQSKRIITIGYGALLKNEDYDVELNGFHSFNIHDSLLFDQAIEEHKQRLETAVSAYKSIASTLTFKAK